MPSTGDKPIPVNLFVQWCWDSPTLVVAGVVSQCFGLIFDWDPRMQGMIHSLFILWLHQSKCYHLESWFLGRLSKDITANFLNSKGTYECSKVNISVIDDDFIEDHIQLMVKTTSLADRKPNVFETPMGSHMRHRKKSSMRTKIVKRNTAE